MKAQITNYISLISIILNPCFVLQSHSEIISMDYYEYEFFYLLYIETERILFPAEKT